MPPTVALIFMLSLLTFRLLTTVIHELGHAIPALLLTKEKVTVYMGSHGDPEKAIQFQIGRLECFFKFNLFYWKGGLCVMHEKEISVMKSFIITIFGPLLSLIVAGIGIIFITYGNQGNVTTLVLFALVFSCALDFIHNIVPNRDAVKLHNGTIVHNDGMQLLTLWKFKNAYKKYQVAFHLMENGEFSAAAEIFEEAIAFGENEETFYRLAIHSNHEAKNYEKAKLLHEAFAEKHNTILNADDYTYLGLIQAHFHEYEEAIATYTKILETMPNNALVLNNRGYTYGLIGKQNEAITDLDKAIKLDKNFAFAWDNRGFSKIMLGQLEDGLLDIEMSLELDYENAYAYRNVGLYYFYKKDYKKALELYEKAFKMDETTYKIQEYITEVKTKIKL